MQLTVSATAAIYHGRGKDFSPRERGNRDTNYGGGFHLKHEFTPNQKSGLAEPLSYAGLFGITANA
ncbi:MAG TPA: hypothetical protein VIB79_08815, partial [Candidatus Binatia bacterium]